MTIAAGDLIAITGGTGAVGRRVVQDLIEGGFRLRLLSRSAPTTAGVEHVAFDLGSPDTLPPGALEGCAALVHLAAYIPASQDDPATAEQCYRTNALGTLTLLKSAQEAQLRHFVQTTSANGYAPGIEAPSENNAMYPSARAPFYLSSKIAQDVFGTYWQESRGLPVTTLRLSSVYGAGVESALFTRFARTLLADKPIRLANGGSFGADFVDVADVTSAVRLFLSCGATGPFNIASGMRTTLLDAAKLLLQLTARGEDLLQIGAEETVEAGFPRMNISKARQFGYVPSDIRTGLGNVVDWVRREAAGSA